MGLVRQWHETRNNSTKRRFAVCKIVQKGGWIGIVDYDKIPLLPANNNVTCSRCWMFSQWNIKHSNEKPLPTEDGKVYKIKRSKLKTIVQSGQGVVQLLLLNPYK